jgi:ubiquinone/menaquinone biosynthesis C-methylase UbiE
MLEILGQKLNDNNKIEILHGEVFDYKDHDIDMVFSCMAFHHIPDIEKTLDHLVLITKPGAWIIVGDLVTEDGSFHGFEPIPHRGFDIAVLSHQFTDAGFNVELVKTYNIIYKTINTATTHYEQFILIAQRA